MSGFEFFFSLFGLLLGLALAEGLGGLARALKARECALTRESAKDQLSERRGVSQRRDLDPRYPGVPL